MENQNQKKHSISFKEIVFLLILISSLHFVYDVWDREFRKPPLPITEQVKSLIRTNQSTWEAVKEINKSIPSQFKK